MLLLLDLKTELYTMRSSSKWFRQKS